MGLQRQTAILQILLRPLVACSSSRATSTDRVKGGQAMAPCWVVPGSQSSGEIDLDHDLPVSGRTEFQAMQPLVLGSSMQSSTFVKIKPIVQIQLG